MFAKHQTRKFKDTKVKRWAFSVILKTMYVVDLVDVVADWVSIMAPDVT